MNSNYLNKKHILKKMGGGTVSRRDFLELTPAGSFSLLGFSFFRVQQDYTSCIIRGDSKSNKVALTFDDGWEASPIERILDVLDEYKIRSSFFVVGRVLDLYKDLWSRALDEGHSIYNHTYNHNSLAEEENFKGIIEWEQAYRSVFSRGDPDPKLIRFPGGAGANSNDVWDYLANYNYIAGVFWSLAGNDTFKGATPESIRGASASMQGGDIVLNHFLERTADALPYIIEDGVTKGLEFVPLLELPGTPIFRPPSSISPLKDEKLRYG